MEGVVSLIVLIHLICVITVIDYLDDFADRVIYGRSRAAAATAGKDHLRSRRCPARTATCSATATAAASDNDSIDVHSCRHRQQKWQYLRSQTLAPSTILAAASAASKKSSLILADITADAESKTCTRTLPFTCTTPPRTLRSALVTNLPAFARGSPPAHQ